MSEIPCVGNDPHYLTGVTTWTTQQTASLIPVHLSYGERLEKMVEDGTLEIDRDYTVTGTAVMDVTMTHTVTARSVETARQAFYEAVQEIGPENMDDYEVDEVRDEDILDVSLD